MADPWDPKPQRGLLCIGGPLDGQWLAVEPEHMDATLHRFPLLPPMPLYGALPPLDRMTYAAPEIRDVVYRRTLLQFIGRQFVVLLVAGMDPGDVLVRLLEGYHPKGERRGP